MSKFVKIPIIKGKDETLVCINIDKIILIEPAFGLNPPACHIYFDYPPESLYKNFTVKGSLEEVLKRLGIDQA